MFEGAFSCTHTRLSPADYDAAKGTAIVTAGDNLGHASRCAAIYGKDLRTFLELFEEHVQRSVLEHEIARILVKLAQRFQ